MLFSNALMHAEYEDDDAVADGDGGDGGGADGDGDDGENHFIHLMLTKLIIMMKMRILIQ